MQNYSGETRIEGTDIRTRVMLTVSGSYGQVIRDVQETWGREGDTWNPPRKVTVTKVLATTTKFPAYHLDGALKAVAALANAFIASEARHSARLASASAEE